MLAAAAERALLHGRSLAEAPVPALTPESAALRRSAAAMDGGEPLLRVTGAGIDVLHSYLRAGWRHAAAGQWLRAGALGRLRQAAAALPPGLGIAVFDAWRPLALQEELFEALGASAGPDGECAVAPPSATPEEPPPHLTGGAVDLTLTWQRRPLALGTGFDEFTDLAQARAFEHVPGPVRTLRRLLYHTLRRHGFVVLAEEWWHFEYGTRLWSALAGQRAPYGRAAP